MRGHNPQLYHGTGLVYQKPDPGRFESSGLYGPGYYLTSDPRVASSYARGTSWHASESDLIKSQIRHWTARAESFRRSVAELRGAGYEKEPFFKAMEQNVVGARIELSRLRATLREIEAGGPNVRIVQVPDDFRLLDADSEVPESVQKRVAAKLGWLRGMGPGMTGHELWHLMLDNLPDDTPDGARQVNKILGSIGFDGIRYRGGRRVPLRDAQGDPIEHDVTVVFDRSVPKLRYGFGRGISMTRRSRE